MRPGVLIGIAVPRGPGALSRGVTQSGLCCCLWYLPEDKLEGTEVRGGEARVQSCEADTWAQGSVLLTALPHSPHLTLELGWDSQNGSGLSGKGPYKPACAQPH